jgi:hypothetical protein
MVPKDSLAVCTFNMDQKVLLTVLSNFSYLFWSLQLILRFDGTSDLLRPANVMHSGRVQSNANVSSLRWSDICVESRTPQETLFAPLLSEMRIESRSSLELLLCRILPRLKQRASISL